MINWFQNLSTRDKLFLSFGAMITLLMLVIGVAFWSLSRIQESQKELHQVHFQSVQELMQLRSFLNRQRAQMLELFATTDTELQQNLMRQIAERRAQVTEMVKKLSDRNRHDPDFIARLTDLEAVREQVNQTRDRQFQLLQQGEFQEARNLSMGEQRDRFEELFRFASALGERASQTAANSVRDSDLQARRALRNSILIGAIAILTGFFLAAHLNRLIADPLKGLSVFAEQIATGDLRAELEAQTRSDEVGALHQAFSRMNRSLREVNREIQEVVNTLAASASEILAASSEIASGAAETATAVNQTTSTVEQVKQTAKVSSQKSKNVSEIAQKAAQAAQNGRQSVEDSIEGMNRVREQMESIAESIVRLSEQTQAIGEIIASVNELAEQSNLLAVNAAIEAAKAGEQGRGFAVVAQEVKNLAAQSKQATAQVRTLLGDIQKATSAAVLATEQGSKAVEAGVKQSQQAGDAIRLLADSIGNAAQASIQITASSEQQFIGMDQISMAMDNIKQAASQNVNGTKQAEAGARNLHELGQKLKLLLQRFKT